MATVWSKFHAGYVLESLADTPDINGQLPVFGVPFFDPDSEPVFGLVPAHEVSSEETVPVPETVPPRVYILLYGKDPTKWAASAFATQEEAEAAMKKKKNAIGYFEANVLPASMVTP